MQLLAVLLLTAPVLRAVLLRRTPLRPRSVLRHLPTVRTLPAPPAAAAHQAAHPLVADRLARLHPGRQAVRAVPRDRVVPALAAPTHLPPAPPAAAAHRVAAAAVHRGDRPAAAH